MIRPSLPAAILAAAAGLLFLPPGDVAAQAPTGPARPSEPAGDPRVSPERGSVARASSSQDDAVHILVSNGMKATMEALERPCARAIGHPLAMQFASTAALKQRIEAGEEFDATFITTDAIDDLIKQRRLDAGSRTELARSVLGIGIRAGSIRPDIHTPEALKRTLLAAKTITYPKDGASRGFIEQMFERMGIAADLKPRIILADGSGAATESVAAGRAQFVLTLFSEILPVPGAEILGPLPGEFQFDIHFGGASSAKARNPQAAKALIAYLARPNVAAIFQAKGLEHQ